MIKIYLCTFLVCLVLGQNAGTQKNQFHIPFPYSECTKSGCQTQQGSVTIDSNWRWLHATTGYDNCFTGTAWNTQYCPDPQTCSKNCAIDGVPPEDWKNPYGTEQINNGVKMQLVTHGQYGDNVGARVYLLESEDKYKMFKLKNKEFSFDTDVSQLDCGLNGALYFVEMEADGGSAKHPGNKAGAKYGTGYCDAQCPHDMKFIYGEANCKDWNNDKGYYGTCCAEFDIWEANKWANAYTAHPCKTPGYYRCSGNECGDGALREEGVCDKDGCDLNPFRNGDKNFYGPGSSYTIDTTKPLSVVTQFITVDNTDTGDLSEVKRFYVQGGKKIDFPKTNISGLGTYNSLTNEHCGNQKRVFGEPNAFADRGGIKKMGDAMVDGMVLVMSLWDDHEANMLWLDSDYPLTADASKAGVKRGPCSRDSGKPQDVEKNLGTSNVGFSNVKFGEIGSTFKFESDGITVKEEKNLQTS